MADSHDALDQEIKLALELAFELRLEDDPDSLDEALDLEVACNYWARVLPAALEYLRKVERQLVVLPLTGALIARLANRLVKQVNSACCHAINFAQTSSSPLFSELATKVASSVASVAMVAAPVGAIVHAADASTSHLRFEQAVAQPARSGASQGTSSRSNIPGPVLFSTVGTSDQVGLVSQSDGNISQIISSVPLAVAISQTSPTAVTASTTDTSSFTDQLTVHGANSAVTFTQSTGLPDLIVSSSGAISTSGYLAAGTYAASGADTDIYGDSGTWSYNLTVSPVAITQLSPIAHISTTMEVPSFERLLVVGGGAHGPVTFTQSTGSPDLTVSSTGAISTSGYLAAGTYTATGTDADAYGDTGTWSYSLTVSPVAITQTSPTAHTLTTTDSALFGRSLVVGGGAHGPVTFTQSTGLPNLIVSSSGAISTSGILAAGTYTATGTDADAYGDTGTWSYSLTVDPVLINQTSPTSTNALTTDSLAFADQLAVSDNNGAVSYSQSTGSPGLTVSSSGAISTSGYLAAGTYTATGADTDIYGDSGSWSYSLTVDPVVINQTSLTQVIASTTDTSSFTDQLGVTSNAGPVTFTQSTGLPDLTVSSSGAISTSGYLAAGTYTATGSDTDAYGDSGTWTYTLTVNPVAIIQSSATSGTSKTTDSSSFAGQLGVTSNAGPVTFTQSTGSPDLTVSSTGAISTSGYLAAGTYTATGTDADAYGDTGTWSYSLTVSPVAITQTSPTAHTLTTTDSALFGRSLVVGGGAHGPVTFTQSTGLPNLIVSSSGAISTSGILAAGTYTATGTDADAYGDTGTWSYSLTVDPVLINQTSPTSTNALTTDSLAFADQLAVSDNNGAVSYSQSTGSPGLTVSSSGAISTSGYLAAGTYTATGADTDIYGDSGSWSYSLTVDPVVINQTSLTQVIASTTDTSSFTDQLGVTSNAGPVTFTQSTGLPDLTVSSSGAISTSGYLAAGTYTATGSDTDAYGDSGTWTYTLTVNPVAIIQSSATSGTSMMCDGNDGSDTDT